jgi:predicted nucleic acid-binding protein
VTVAELYAGTRSIRDARLLDRIVGTFARAERLTTPTVDDWRLAGQLIARSVRLYGAVEPRDHLADVLIVLTAARLRGTVLTANMRHFERWARLATGAGHDVAIIHSDAFTTAT